MRIRPFAAVFLLSPLAFAACTAEPGTGDDAGSSSSIAVESSSSVRVTRNVTYRGVIEAAGISIYQEGTHRLSLEDGRFILLESTAVDLDAHEGKAVEVKGSLRPTVEAGGIIMDVQSIADTGISSVVSSAEASSEVSSDAVSSVTESSIPASSSLGAVSSVATPPPASSSVLSSSAASSAAASVAPPVSGDADLQARVQAMLAADLSAGNWVQRYCTEHIGFCVPIHKSWWFKSFGTTTTALWHVEVSNEEILELGDGPVSINLVSGTVDAAGASDGQVSVQGGTVTGYKAWTDNRHFEITGDARLEAAIRYMVEHLQANEPSI